MEVTPKTTRIYNLEITIQIITAIWTCCVLWAYNSFVVKFILEECLSGSEVGLAG